MKQIISSVVILVAVLGLAQPEASAAPYPVVFQTDDHGDVALIGNILARDCRGGGQPIPTVGTVGNCGANTGDSGVDVFWRSEQPGVGQAAANDTITVAAARSTAMLNLPVGATILYARLYWAATLANNPDTPDGTVTLDRPGGSSVTVTGAGAPYHVATYGVWVSQTTNYFYQGAADVTAEVTAWGNGAYRVSGVNSQNIVGQTNEGSYAGWALVVFYHLATEAYRNLTLFEGFDRAQQGVSVTADLTGFLVPVAGYGGTLGVIAWEGDSGLVGDSLSFGGNTLSDLQNPANDFFNSTRSKVGSAVSVAGDLPQMSGAANSMTGLDLDVVNVTPYLTGGQTSAHIVATGSSNDSFAVGAFITSITTYKPLFDSTKKTVVDLNGGTVRPNDILEYTITTENTGNDTALETVLTDPLPAAVSFVTGSLRITLGANMGPLTDQSGDDQGEVVGGVLTVRLGVGANATVGGTMVVGDKATVVFRATYRGDIAGTIQNQASVSARGASGMPTDSWASDDNGDGSGNPTSIDPDTDGDGVTDSIDNCDFVVNPGQQDLDGDGIGNACDPDKDGDGVIAASDCDDMDASRYPGAPELCDGKDNACAGSVPANEIDNDGDGYVRCAPWVGSVPGILGGGDCDDTSASASTCHNTCHTYYRDADGDTYGNASITSVICSATPPAGHVANSTDCDDTKPHCWGHCAQDVDGDGWCVGDGGDCNDANAAVHPGAAEIAGNGVDDNCDGNETCYVDSDKDGYRTASTVSTADIACLTANGHALAAAGIDCNDNDPAINPATIWYKDADGDLYSDGTTVIQCLQPAGYELASALVSMDVDCDDTDDLTYPGAAELCDAKDNACIGALPTNEVDADNDHYIACLGWTTSRPGSSPGILGGGDCLDTNGHVNPGAEEVCDGYDTNCSSGSSLPDDPTETDPDGDRYLACSGYVEHGLNKLGGGDCDNADPTSYPGALEQCDGYANDCSGTVPAIEIDNDSDGYVECNGWDDTYHPNVLVLGGGDCNDTNPNVNPGHAEINCNGINDDCNFATPDDPTGIDADHDGFTVGCGHDCDDSNFFVHPGAVENCSDGIDNDCNGLTDAMPGSEDPACTGTCVDADGDGYRSTTCGGSDCNDLNLFINPAAGENCVDGIDNNCDGFADDDDPLCPAGCADLDGDGYRSAACGGSDCDDTRADVHPGLAEICNDGIDNNCNGRIDGADPQCLAGCDDADGDGYESRSCGGTDCNDTNAAIHPGAGEVCGDGVDNNCNGLVDGADPLCPVGCVDADHDGYPSAACGGSDCDDTRSTVNPGRRENCKDGIDNDCNGLIDGADPQCPSTCWDADGDGYADASCGGTDCDDTAFFVNPGVGENCTNGVDDNCDGLIDYQDTAQCPAGCVDEDGDGYLATSCGGRDCNDNDVAINPGAVENCSDTFDNNCDGVIDGQDVAACPPGCVDGDGDGYPPLSCGGSDCDDASPATHPGTPEIACDSIDNDCNVLTQDAPDADRDGYASAACASGADCDDGNPLINPAAGERCNDGIDNNCDGLVDGADPLCPGSCPNPDADHDGYMSVACGGSDCDDTNPNRHPGAGENCNDGIDNDCNGLIDGADLGSCPPGCVDFDRDGYPSATCGGTDCNDSRFDVHPGAGESCNDGVDNDCNGLVDGADIASCPAGCVDADGDGYESAACGGTDCNDANFSINPAAGEQCVNGVDDNCDGRVDTADPLCPNGCVDLDHDGYESAACGGSDCDDSNPRVHPGAVEICGNGIDDNCNGLVDDVDPACPVGCVDADGDGYRSTTCGGQDCNDSNRDVFPGAGERCNDGIDNDCNGLIDAEDPQCAAGCADADGDGYKDQSCGGADCNDQNAGIRPGAAENCSDGIDNDCDLLIDGADVIDCPPGCIANDDDGDGYPDAVCGGSDCNDGSAAVNPGMLEIACNGIDDDCSAVTPDDPDAIDGDQDGYTQGCGHDCNDANPLVHPGIAERCDDGVDNDCNGLIDAADTLGCPAGCADADGDGYPDIGCGGSDCDDSDFTANPGAGENCVDGVDNDCNGLVDGDDPACTPSCPDLDGDGYRAAACGGSDCDDTAASTHPGGGENCFDGVDNDCNGLIDGADLGSCPPGCVDADGDGYESVACGGSDCNDAAPNANPGAIEICDGIDNNCNGEIDEGLPDADGDGVADCVDVDQDGDNCPDIIDANPTVASVDDDGDGYAADCDCDDADPTIHVDCEKKVWNIAGGCRCDSTGGAAGLAFLLVAALGAWRRRSTTRVAA